MNAIRTADTDRLAHEVRVLESEVHRQVRPEADTGGDQELIRIARAYKGNDLFEHIGFPYVVASNALTGIDAVVVPRLRAMTVNPVELNVPGVDLVGKRFNHLVVLPFME